MFSKKKNARYLFKLLSTILKVTLLKGFFFCLSCENISPFRATMTFVPFRNIFFPFFS